MFPRIYNTRSQTCSDKIINSAPGFNDERRDMSEKLFFKSEDMHDTAETQTAPFWGPHLGGEAAGRGW